MSSLFTPVVLWWLGSVSLLFFVLSLLLTPYVLVRMPADYFTRPAVSTELRNGRASLRNIVFTVVKNLLGFIFFIMGLAMLVLPGQGVLTILLGIMLLNFPGKQKLELWIVRRMGVLTGINWLREKNQVAPIELPNGDS